MKLFMNGNVYVSQKDIKFLLKTDSFDFPERLIFEAFPTGVFSFKDINCNDFISFESDEAKKYFKLEKSIANYSVYKNMDISQIQGIIKRNRKRLTHYLELIRDCEEFDEVQEYYHEAASIRNVNNALIDIINFKKGIINIDFPEYEKHDPDKKYKVFLKKMMEPISYN